MGAFGVGRLAHLLADQCRRAHARLEDPCLSLSRQRETILEHVLGYCVPRDIPFKFIRSKQLLLLRNGKYAPRGSSGKFVTIYPRDDDQLHVILTELGQALEGQPGPYILSDLRWGEGPLFVRYGGFAERYCLGASGELELAITDDSGSLVPDHRGPTFQTPTWVPMPDFLVTHLEARNKATVGDIPYRIEAALHFSNGGGLYSGVDERTGEEVVLKEARPHAGLSTDTADAITRIRQEAETLQRLAGLDVVPAFRDLITIGDHLFLVEDLVDGTSLRGLITTKYPLVDHEPDEEAIATYAAWALGLCERVEQAVAAIHERGIVIGDLHPSNMLVDDDGRVMLIDFEVASPVEEARRPTLAEPGFMSPSDRTGFDIDRYALACLRLHMFLPLTNLLVLERAKAYEMAEAITDLFPVPSTFAFEAAQTIVGSGLDDGGGAPKRPRHRLEPDADGWAGARQSMTQAILTSATPDRNDRLFPGDIEQFSPGGGLNVAYGAAGVLYALDAAGAGRFPDYEDWLIQRAMNPESGSRLGFYDGLHGVAYVLDHLGHRAEALKVLDIAADELGDRWDRLGLDLFGGLSGIGLNLMHLARATGDAGLSEAAEKVAEAVADRLGAEEDVAEESGGDHPFAGLTRGSSGPALLFLRLYEQTGDAALLDLAATALRQDLRRCVEIDGGVLHVNEGWRSMPYLADGTVGIGMVLADYLAHGQDEGFIHAAAGIRKAAQGDFYIEPGLFYGRAGMVLALSRGLQPGTTSCDPVVASHVRRLTWHAIEYKDQLAFPGEQLMRLSMDLASGTAGVLLALAAALHDEPVNLPFLAAPPAPTGTPGSQRSSTPSIQKGGD